MTHDIEDTDFPELEQAEPLQISNEECEQIADGVGHQKVRSENQAGFRV